MERRPTFGAKVLEEAKANRVVWARVRGYPSWPAQILSEAAAQKKLGKLPHKQLDVPVMFFGTLEIAWIYESDIFSFGEGIEMGLMEKVKQKSFHKALVQVYEFLALEKKRKAPQYWWCRPQSNGLEDEEDNALTPCKSPKPQITATTAKDDDRPKQASKPNSAAGDASKSGRSEATRDKYKDALPQKQHDKPNSLTVKEKEKSKQQPNNSKPALDDRSAKRQKVAPAAPGLDSAANAAKPKDDAAKSKDEAACRTQNKAVPSASAPPGGAAKKDAPAASTVSTGSRPAATTGAAPGTANNGKSDAPCITSGMASPTSQLDEDILRLPAEIRRLAGIKLVKPIKPTASQNDGRSAPVASTAGTASNAGHQKARDTPAGPSHGSGQVAGGSSRLARRQDASPERTENANADNAKAPATHAVKPGRDADPDRDSKRETRAASRAVLMSPVVRRDTPSPVVRPSTTPSSSQKLLPQRPGQRHQPLRGTPLGPKRIIDKAAERLRHAKARQSQSLSKQPPSQPKAESDQKPAAAAAAEEPAAEAAALLVVDKEPANSEAPATSASAPADDQRPAASAVGDTVGDSSPCGHAAATSKDTSAQAKAVSSMDTGDGSPASSADLAPPAPQVKAESSQAVLSPRDKAVPRELRHLGLSLSSEPSSHTDGRVLRDRSDRGEKKDAAAPPSPSSRALKEAREAKERAAKPAGKHPAEDAKDGSSHGVSVSSSQPARAQRAAQPPAVAARISSQLQRPSIPDPAALMSKRKPAAGGEEKQLQQVTADKASKAVMPFGKPSSAVMKQQAPAAPITGSVRPASRPRARVEGQTNTHQLSQTEPSSSKLHISMSASIDGSSKRSAGNSGVATLAAAAALDNMAGPCSKATASSAREATPLSNAADEDMSDADAVAALQQLHEAERPKERGTGHSGQAASRSNLWRGSDVASSIINFKWPQEEPVLPPMQQLPYSVPKTWLLQRPPKYEHIKRNVWLSRQRPKRLHKDEISVCMCTLEAPGSDGIQKPGCGKECLNRVSFLHCDPKSCPCGEACSNKPFHLLKGPKMEPFPTENRGWGVRSQQDVLKGSFMLEYVGEVIDSLELARRMEHARLDGEPHFYIMELGPGLYIDARKRGNHARLLNSSCEPNCETQKWTDAATGEVRVGIFAKRDIQAGEELTYDYFYSHYGVSAVAAGSFKCMCGAVNCRGTMDVNPEKRKDLGRRLEVYWDGDGEFYRGTIIGYSATSRKHMVLYDDGDKERVCLDEVPHRWLEPEAVPASAASGAVAQRNPVIKIADDSAATERASEKVSDAAPSRTKEDPAMSDLAAAEALLMHKRPSLQTESAQLPLKKRQKVQGMAGSLGAPHAGSASSSQQQTGSLGTAPGRQSSSAGNDNSQHGSKGLASLLQAAQAVGHESGPSQPQPTSNQQQQAAARSLMPPPSFSHRAGPIAPSSSRGEPSAGLHRSPSGAKMGLKPRPSRAVQPMMSRPMQDLLGVKLSDCDFPLFKPPSTVDNSALSSSGSAVNAQCRPNIFSGSTRSLQLGSHGPSLFQPSSPQQHQPPSQAAKALQAERPIATTSGIHMTGSHAQPLSLFGLPPHLQYLHSQAAAHHTLSSMMMPGAGPGAFHPGLLFDQHFQGPMGMFLGTGSKLQGHPSWLAAPMVPGMPQPANTMPNLFKSTSPLKGV